jgi:MFS family permease
MFHADIYIAQVIFTVIACWLASGIVFGFAALKPVLVDVGVYRELCTPEELLDDVDVCFEQDLRCVFECALLRSGQLTDHIPRLNFFFAIASTTCNVSALPVGTILDRYGPRVCAVLGSVFLAAGALLMGYAFQIPEFDGFVFGNVMLALGGTFIFLPSFQIANAFPKYSGTIVATVTGAFDASAAVFLFYRLAYQSSNGAFSPQKFFFGYLAVPVLIFIAQFTIMSPDNYKTMPELEQKLEKAENVFEDVSFCSIHGRVFSC